MDACHSPAPGHPITIAVRNKSTAVSDHEVQAAIPAFQKQISRDFGPSGWGINATLHWIGPDEKPSPDWWMLVVFDNADQAGALGYHDLTSTGQPLGKVFAKTAQLYGHRWTVTFSHEMLEMLGDPNINLCAFDEISRRLYAYEVCDAVEADELGYDIDGVLVSDFVLPAWFRSMQPEESDGKSLAFRSKVTAPLQLLPGGYIGYYDLDAGAGWQQLMAQGIENVRAMNTRTSGPLEYSKRAWVGSRRERRRTPKSQWARSTVD